jgi:hypothetical protein
MASGKGGKNREQKEAIIKMPPPPSLVESLQAKLEAAGVSPELFEITGIGPDGKGGTRLVAAMRPDIAEGLAKLWSIQLFSPDEPRFRMEDIDDPAPAETQPTAKLWTGKERGKRSKPKSDVPEVT